MVRHCPVWPKGTEWVFGMPRKLNSKQLRFAAKVAEGQTLVGAYREVYQHNGKRETASRTAKKKAKHPGIAAAIEEMRIQLLPDPGEARAIQAHLRAVAVKLATEAGDEKVRLQAVEWLYEELKQEIAERERLEGAKRRQEGPAVEVIAELGALYAKALPGREPPPLAEVAAEAPGEE